MNTPATTPPTAPTPPAFTPAESGKIKPMVLLWALGVPIPIVLIIMAVRACT